jgi:hypothetical protein
MHISTIVSTIFLVVHYLYSGVNAIPGDQLCAQPSQWVRRACNTETGGDREWTDTCLSMPYWKHGICPLFTMCQNGWTDDNPPRMTISCVPVADNPYQTAPGLQVGYEFIAAENRQQTVTVAVRANMADASIAALLEGVLILTFQYLFN